MFRALGWILVLASFFSQSHAILRCITHIHKESGPEIWGFGDQHIDYMNAKEADCAKKKSKVNLYATV